MPFFREGGSSLPELYIPDVTVNPALSNTTDQSAEFKLYGLTKYKTLIVNSAGAANVTSSTISIYGIYDIDGVESQNLILSGAKTVPTTLDITSYKGLRFFVYGVSAEQGGWMGSVTINGITIK